MNSASLLNCSEVREEYKTMQAFGEGFLTALPVHIKSLKIPGRMMSDDSRRGPILAQIEQISEVQNVMHDVLRHPITQEAQFFAESTFDALLSKNTIDEGVLKFFNGWNETHKTTSLVSAKIIMRLSADAISVPVEKQVSYNRITSHMHEVAKDDFGLGHSGHDGMYCYMTAAIGAHGWVENRNKVKECNEFSEYLYEMGVAEHKSANSVEHKQSIMNAMMVSISSELWNGREYNYIAQYIEDKLIYFNASLRSNVKELRNAKGYVMGHAGEVENKHGLHALAAAQAYGRTVDMSFNLNALETIMLDYNRRIGRAFQALHDALTFKN